MSWKIPGSYFETCSCESCARARRRCRFGATYDYCRVALVFNVQDGDVEGTDVAA